MRYAITRDRVENAKLNNAKSLDRLSSQKDITKLSDDPVGVMQMIRYRNKISNIQQYQKNVEFSKGFIETTETSLQAISENLMRARELAIAMSNDTYADDSRDAAAREVREIMNEVVRLANSTYNGRHVFGGFRNQTPSLSPDGDYLGDDGQIFLQISEDNFRPINIQARNLFQATPDERDKGHFDLMHTLNMLYEGLNSNDKKSVHTALDELAFQSEKTTSFQATVGAIWKSVHDTEQRLVMEEELGRLNLSKIQDADIYDASSEFKRTESVLQGTLMASNKVLQPSLLNFMQ